MKCGDMKCGDMKCGDMKCGDMKCGDMKCGDMKCGDMKCNIRFIYFSQKQLPCKIKLRLVIVECAGYIFWQLFFTATIVKEAEKLVDRLRKLLCT